MILVDSSVWISLFRGDDTPQTRLMISILQNDDEELAIADIILLEVLQGFRSEKQAQAALRSVEGLPCFTLGGNPSITKQPCDVLFKGAPRTRFSVLACTQKSCVQIRKSMHD